MQAELRLDSFGQGIDGNKSDSKESLNVILVVSAYGIETFEFQDHCYPRLSCLTPSPSFGLRDAH